MPILPSHSTKEESLRQKREKAIVEEVYKLLEVDFIKEVYYLEWLANVEDMHGLHWLEQSPPEGQLPTP